MRRLRLGNLVLVVREDEVQSAAVDVEGRAEELLAHRGALDVPAGPAAAPGRVPRRLARLLSLPEREIERFPLELPGRHPLAGSQIVQVAARELRVLGPARHLEVHVPAGGVGDPGIEERLDEREDLGDDLGHPRRDVRRNQAELRGVLLEGLDVAVGQGRRVLPRLARGVDDLVVDVRVVPDVRDAVAAVSEITHHDVEDGEGPGVSDVYPRVDGGTTHVQTHFTWPEWLERFLATGERVVDGLRGGAAGKRTREWGGEF